MGRASRRKKNRSKKPQGVKVDEVFSAGPFTVRRASRYTEIVFNWPAGEHEKMLERARTERPELKTSIDEDIRFH